MDEKTLAAYERDAAAFATEWESQPTPVDLQIAVRKFFAPGPSADIGCGSGRDTAWLVQSGFAAVGYDPSEALLAQARRLHPGVEFRRASLPELDGVADASFVNVLCETVIMHLEPVVIPAAVRRLITILKPGGTLYLTWRLTEGTGGRDKHERLYAGFDAKLVLNALKPAILLLNEEAVSPSSGKLVTRVIARMP
jgi:SAM-dependent methyltransferase